MLSEAGASRLMDRRKHADYTKQRRGEIRERHAHADRGITWTARSHHHSTERLDDGIHRFAGSRIALASKAGDGAIDDPRIQLLGKCVARAQTIQCARLKFSTMTSALFTRSP